MTTFNKKKVNKAITNHEGAPAYSLSAKMELYTLAVTSMFSDKFYEGNEERVSRLRKLLTQVDPTFVAKLAIYTREKMYLRTFPLVLVVELAKIHNGDNLISNTVEGVVQRVDEITELLSYYAIANEKKEIKKLGKLSKQIQKGLSKAFNNFDEYQFAKYDRDGAIKLRDALFIVHPKPKDDAQKVIFDKIVSGTLDTPYTWETELSAKGNKPEVWSELIDSGRFPYMAAMRNLRNIVNSGVPRESLKKVTDMLSDSVQVSKSKQLPFRYLSAYKELRENESPNTSLILNSLEKAIEASVVNLRGFDSNITVAIGCDTSGSMAVPVSPKSTIQNYEIGLLLGMLLQHKCQSVVSGIFGDTFKIINLPQTNILDNTAGLINRVGEVGYSTNGYLVLDGLKNKGVKADKIMMFTDCQMWDSYGGGNSMKQSWAEYKKFYPTAKLYLFDLAGYGNSPISTDGADVYMIAGWSDKVFDVLDAYDKGSNAIEQIDKIVV